MHYDTIQINSCIMAALMAVSRSWLLCSKTCLWY